jgi:hypothetical protein
MSHWLYCRLFGTKCIKCKECGWIGQESELQDHVMQRHRDMIPGGILRYEYVWIA